MRKDKGFQFYMLLLAVVLLLTAFPAWAENEEPLTLTVEADPDCLLSEAGDMTFFRFTLKNTLEEDYVLDALTLQGDLLEEPKLIADTLTISANDVLEFTLEKVRIEEDEFDRELSFQLTWQTVSFAEEDEAHEEPILTDHVLSIPIRIERFIEPVMGVSMEPDVLLAREGDPVTVTYTLVNDTKFDMTNLTLQDMGISQTSVTLPKNSLNAGEKMEAKATFTMGNSALELNPTAQYTVRGVESKSSASQTVTVEYVQVDLSMVVEKYPATAEGTLFRITLINDGTHPMTDIRLTDEIGTLIEDGIALDAKEEKTVSCTVPSAVSSGSVRYISFEATGVDCVGGTFSVKSPSAYEVLPFVDSDQVRLKLSVTLEDSVQNDDGSNRMKVLFEIRNDSKVPIRNAVVTEGDYFKGVVNEYDFLATGATTFEKEFVVPAGTRSLTFVLTAMDPAQNQYASVPMTLDLSPLTAPKPTSLPPIQPGERVDVTGTIYDTELYIRLFRMVSLIVFALLLVFLLLAVIFHVAELNVRRWLPKESALRPFGPRKTPTGPIPVKAGGDAVHDQFGYLQPAKLRYMDRTDRMPTVGQEEEPAKAVSSVTIVSNTAARTLAPAQTTGVKPTRRTGEITAVPIHKTHTRPVMMSSDDTMPFAPVHEGQAAEPAPAEQSAGRIEAAAHESGNKQPRVIETKAKPRIIPRKKLEIVRISQV